MHVITVEFVVSPEYSDQFARRVIKQAADSLAREEKCHVFDVCRSNESGESFFLYEVYEDEKSFLAHLETEHFRSFDAECADWIVSKSVANYTRLS